MTVTDLRQQFFLNFAEMPVFLEDLGLQAKTEKSTKLGFEFKALLDINNQKPNFR